MSTPTTTTSLADKYLETALATVQTEIGRTDGKANLPLAFNGDVLAGLTSPPVNRCRRPRGCWEAWPSRRSSSPQSCCC